MDFLLNAFDNSKLIILDFLMILLKHYQEQEVENLLYQQVQSI